jgi:thiol-disulfide isomerase/thioredoxin
MTRTDFMKALRRRDVIAAVVSVAIVIGVVLTFVTPGESGEGATNSAVTAARVEVGYPAPNFLVPTLDGGMFELAAANGHPVWINVWATWCPPCRAEFPDIDEIRRGAEPDGLVFLAMNFGEDLGEIESYLQNTGYDFTVGLDASGEFAEMYQVLGLPMHVFVAADGTLDAVRVGGMTRDEIAAKVAELTASSTAAAVPSSN